MALFSANKKQGPSKEELELAKTRDQAAATLGRGMVDVKDIIAPPAIQIEFDYIRVGEIFYRTLFVSGYPRFVGANWLAPIINFDHTLDLAFFYYPVEAKGILDDLRRKIAEMEATVNGDLEKGRVVDPAVRIALEDAQALQEQLVAGIERFFQFSFYITIPAESLDELNNITKQVEATLGSLLIVTKHATLQQESGFQTTLPTFTDKLLVTRNMDTTSLATTFPFTSSELTGHRADKRTCWRRRKGWPVASLERGAAPPQACERTTEETQEAQESWRTFRGRCVRRTRRRERPGPYRSGPDFAEMRLSRGHGGGGR